MALFLAIVLFGFTIQNVTDYIKVSQIEETGNSQLRTELKAIDYLFADFDKGTKEEMRAKIYSSPIVPSLIIESKNGYHV